MNGYSVKAYSVIQWRGYYYIIAAKGFPATTAIGPYRSEAEAQRAADKLNKEAAGAAL